ncbi:diacylglycerol kinase [Allofranklinella schreckenbergeri]|uniref:Diacylglycerol kinase n=1 Tax=Allofranklinella schreckenbergeri TaxID=1076744 RepID=A0A3M6R4T1_9BURK|nr:diacylglycerol kinase [Allofranklinella schreckenbergeri]RMX01642.1 diacylglycerol kinase [Allofranklinella schreckenbergeri]RMX10291.1 diacylglycerol kinase [Allofranklinella schreckenbergeri]
MSDTPPIANIPRKTGWARLQAAACNSWAGVRAAGKQAAFRQELVLAAVLIPAAFWVGRNWLEVAFLASVVVLVLVVEVLNSAIEAVVDRIGPEWHPLSKDAKDLGSAAVLLCLLFAFATWTWALYVRWFA